MKHRYFPIFLDISDKNILFVGAGKIASRRMSKLIEYDGRITAIAPFCDDEIERLYNCV